MHEYTGVIHVHSTCSDGSGTVPEIIRAGQECGLDFLILTDHNTLRAAQEGFDGWHQDMLMIVGEEVSARCGHCLAIGTDAHIPHRQSGRSIIDAIREQQGLSFLAHPHGVYRPVLKRRDHTWKDWDIPPFTGMELWSYMFDWAADFHYSRFLSFYRNPNARIKGPFPQTLATWDRLCRSARVVAIGGVDAHAKRYSPFPLVVFPYRMLFNTVRTHVLSQRPLGRSNGAEDRASMLHALGEGSCYLAWDGLAPASGFRFSAAGNPQLGMGCETAFQSPVAFEVNVPLPADVTIYRDGHPFYRSSGCTRLGFTAHTPGVFRVEARRSGLPWIYSNPIYLRA
jgi:hypothetical protein